MGRVLLAALPEDELIARIEQSEIRPLTPKTVTDHAALIGIVHKARAEGFALADEELELGLRSIAVPVRTRQNRVVAAMNVGVHAARVSSQELIERFLPVLRENAQMFVHQLG
jgi:IclR family pca regulon transcriptional regulator